MSQPSSPATTDSPNQERRLLVRLTGALGAFAGMILAGCGITIGGSGARGPQDMAYRRRAAQHLYQRNPAHVYHGDLPPMLHAIAVMEVRIGGNGRVQGIRWRRRPDHAPEVVQLANRMVQAASPFPAPGGMGVTYTDTWLFVDSQRFQLDAITEGQQSYASGEPEW